MFASLSRLINRMRTHARQEKRDMILADFEIVEREGHIYLTVCGVPYGIAKDSDTARSIVDRINTARESALKYNRL